MKRKWRFLGKTGVNITGSLANIYLITFIELHCFVVVLVVAARIAADEYLGVDEGVLFLRLGQ